MAGSIQNRAPVSDASPSCEKACPAALDACELAQVSVCVSKDAHHGTDTAIPLQDTGEDGPGYEYLSHHAETVQVLQWASGRSRKLERLSPSPRIPQLLGQSWTNDLQKISSAQKLLHARRNTPSPGCKISNLITLNLRCSWRRNVAEARLVMCSAGSYPALLSLPRIPQRVRPPLFRVLGLGLHVSRV
ncbi:hypothetical protein BV20DRAFT_155662 [Pilatotrama ljubarskyi]|nr:hypothetical protein BV20DRAFT_155662 [Pilatotrama ljubarskyi]